MSVRRFIRVVALLAAVVPAGLPVTAAERRERLALPLPPGGTVKIDTYRGSLEIEERDVHEALLTVEIETAAETEAEAAQARANLRLHAATVDGVAVFTVRNPAESRALFVWEEKRRLDLYLRAVVPRGSALDLRVLDGSITVAPVAGPVRAEVREGNVFLRRVDRDADVRIETGEVIVSRCLGNLTVRAQQGLIRVGTIGGAGRLVNRSGDVEVMMARGPLDAYAEAGNVTVGFPRTVGGPATVRASGGSVYASIDPTARCEIEAAARWGRVALRLPLVLSEGGDGANRVAGRLNAGGPLLTFRADGGSVTIRRGETLFEE